MRIKSYFAESVQDAMQRALDELGPDAMLIHSKNTEPELRQLGKYEVVFGISNSEPRATAPVAAQKPEVAASDPVLHEISDLRKELEVIRRSIARGGHAPGSRRFAPELEDWASRLEGAGFSNDFSEEIVSAIQARDGLKREARDSLEQVIVAEIERRVQVSAELGKAVMLVGPPGSGKTTTLVKFALQYGIKARIAVDIFTTDAFRVGAWEQLSRYARIAGANFESFHNVTALTAALEKRTGDRLILIDTPGYSLSEMNEASEWASYAAKSHIDVHLVLPATLRMRVAADMAQRFSIFGCRKLVATHCDEPQSAVSACELAARTGLALSFLGTGQQIPEDLRTAHAADLVREAIPRVKSAAA